MNDEKYKRLLKLLGDIVNREKTFGGVLDTPDGKEGFKKEYLQNLPKELQKDKNGQLIPHTIKKLECPGKDCSFNFLKHIHLNYNYETEKHKGWGDGIFVPFCKKCTLHPDLVELGMQNFDHTTAIIYTLFYCDNIEHTKNNVPILVNIANEIVTDEEYKTKFWYLL